jgi:hypothetical protein
MARLGLKVNVKVSNWEGTTSLHFNFTSHDNLAVHCDSLKLCDSDWCTPKLRKKYSDIISSRLRNMDNGAAQNSGILAFLCNTFLQPRCVLHVSPSHATLDPRAVRENTELPTMWNHAPSGVLVLNVSSALLCSNTASYFMKKYIYINFIAVLNVLERNQKPQSACWWDSRHFLIK